MEFLDTAIPAVKLITPKRFTDHRGFFAETYNADLFSLAGIEQDYVQDNHSLSRQEGTLRGLHFQLPPYAQAKLVRVVRGSIFDVAVDIRHGSPTFGQHVSVVLYATDFRQLYIPAGFAHGFCTLEPDTEVLYKVSQPYSPEHDRGLLWNDPDLAIAWPNTGNQTILSDKDKLHPVLRDLPACFKMDGL